MISSKLLAVIVWKRLRRQKFKNGLVEGSLHKSSHSILHTQKYEPIFSFIQKTKLLIGEVGHLIGMDGISNWFNGPISFINVSYQYVF